LRSGVTSTLLYYRSPWTLANFGEGIVINLHFHIPSSLLSHTNGGKVVCDHGVCSMWLSLLPVLFC
jgi:hypothetical protein